MKASSSAFQSKPEKRAATSFFALLAENTLHVVSDMRRDRAVGHRATRRVHISLGQTHTPLSIHRGEVHLARGRGREPDVAGFPDLGRDDVDVDREQTAFPDRVHDGRDHRRSISYQKGIKVSKAEMKRLDIIGDPFHPEWNYTIRPRQS
jgi:Rhodopirellula transposase DDE domain